MCAEEVLRLNHTVEYEEGSCFGSRQNRALIPINEYDYKRFDVAMENAARDNMHFSVQLIKNDIPKEDEQALFKLIQNHLYDSCIDLPDGKKRVFAPFKTTFCFDFSPAGGKEFACGYLEDRFYRTPREIVMISYDESRKQRGLETIDTYLAKKKAEGFPSQMLAKARRYYLRNPDSKLNPEIRTLQGDICWGYGDAVVLTQNASKKIGDSSDGEALLLRPFENNGTFFRINLGDSDTIMIGPKKWQQQFRSEITQHKVRYFAIEDMARRHFEYFGVPREIRIKPVLAKKM